MTAKGELVTAVVNRQAATLTAKRELVTAVETDTLLH